MLKAKQKGGGKDPSFTITGPTNMVHKTHVDTDLNWSGQDAGAAFELQTKLGEGAYGVVWKALHRDTEMTVAIKTVIVNDKKKQASLTKEIDLLKKCKNSNITNLYGCCQGTDDQLWIMMEYCGLGSLTDFKDVTNEPFTEEEISAIFGSTLRGLVYLHAIDIIHRDIKSANILMNEKGEVKIADFGVSSQLSSKLAQAQTVIGTPLFMSPEVLEGEKYNKMADMWSLGITAIELADGKPPYAGEPVMKAMFKISTEDAPTLKDKSKWSTEFSDFVARCVVKDPKARSSAGDLLTHPFVTKTFKDSPRILAAMAERCRQKKLTKSTKLLGSELSDDDSSGKSGQYNTGGSESGSESSGKSPATSMTISSPTFVGQSNNPIIVGLNQAILTVKEQIANEKKKQLGDGSDEIRELSLQLEAIELENKALQKQIDRAQEDLSGCRSDIDEGYLGLSIREIVQQLSHARAAKARLQSDAAAMLEREDAAPVSPPSSSLSSSLTTSGRASIARVSSSLKKKSSKKDSKKSSKKHSKSKDRPE
eukprot:TRINITY_DN1365_c0_g2_i1.p1 TRINITY_DN1365_c0_g2~~TRINITY_DN1365_c0_g2_i1.p1  ORF type:complete len:583 (-),score=167.45 TRINITY_DN1365_c0_g2_i1:173-1783(-)